MFNPKENLLDQQLSVSGLEMQLDPFSAISAGMAVFGGIMGSKSAREQNARAERIEREQKAAAKAAADATNKYNAEAFAAEKQNYFNSKDFQYETSLRNWKYNQAIRDYEYKSIVERYGRSVENTENQLIFNSIAAIDAYEAEQAATEDILVEDAFGKQASMEERLQAQGEAQMGQAGVSRNKRIQSRLAGIGRNKTISDESVENALVQSQRNMRQIDLQKYAADMAAKASMMIRPEAIPDLPKPELGPDRIFVEPIKATPAYVPPAMQVSTVAPLISGLGSAASTLATVDWSSTFGGGGGGTTTQQSAAVSAGWPGNRNY